MKATVKLRSLVSGTAVAFAALALVGGCATPGEGEGEEPVGEQAQALCCIDYTCPANGFSTFGCKSGGLAGALSRCNENCPVSCQAGQLECD